VSEPFDRAATGRESTSEPNEEASENVLDGWPSAEDATGFDDARRREASSEAEPGRLTSGAASVEPEPEPELGAEPKPEPEPDPVAAEERAAAAGPRPSDGEQAFAPLVDPHPVVHASSEHAPGELRIPPGYSVLEGEPSGARRAVGIVVSRFNGEVTSWLLSGALDELAAAGVEADSITVMPVPGAFELPIGAMALAKTRRYACIVALGCVIRGDTPHFDYVAAEAASGIQLAALETGVPVSFGVLTLERADQADARVDKGAEAVRTGLEMADLFAHLRAAAAR
jgi:6,7-dimethyl-8-ribityllumazine synthase